MRIVVKSSRRELLAVGGIWLFLFVVSLTAWLLLKLNANHIINYIEYVETGRFGRAEVLYEEGKKYAKSLLERSAELNEKAKTKVAISATDRDVVQALTSYERAEKLDPRPRHDPQRATHYDMQGVVYDISDNRLMQRVLHAEAFLARGDIRNALGYVALASEMDTSSSEMLLVKAYAEVASDNTSGALETMDRLYATGKVTSRARLLKGELLQKIGNIGGAIVELEQAIKADARNSDLYKRLAMYQLQANRKTKALATFKSGIDNGGSTDGNYMHLYGISLFEQGLVKESLEALELAAELEPSSGAIQWDLARSYSRAGKSGLAGRSMQHAIKLEPSLAENVF